MSKRACSIPGCNTTSQALGWCNKHYHRWRTTGDPTATKYDQHESPKRLTGRWILNPRKRIHEYQETN